MHLLLLLHLLFPPSLCRWPSRCPSLSSLANFRVIGEVSLWPFVTRHSGTENSGKVSGALSSHSPRTIHRVANCPFIPTGECLGVVLHHQERRPAGLTEQLISYHQQSSKRPPMSTANHLGVVCRYQKCCTAGFHEKLISFHRIG